MTMLRRNCLLDGRSTMVGIYIYSQYRCILLTSQSPHTTFVCYRGAPVTDLRPAGPIGTRFSETSLLFQLPYPISSHPFSFPLPPLLFPFRLSNLSPSLHILLLPSAHLLNPTREHCKLSRWVWAEPRLQIVTGAFWAKIVLLVTVVLSAGPLTSVGPLA